MTISTDSTQKEGLEMITSLNRAAERSRTGGDFKSALEKLTAALEFCPGVCSTRAEILNNIGHVQVFLGMFDAALLSFGESAGIHDETGNHIDRGRQLGNIGSIYRDQNKYDKALNSYSQSIAALRKEDHPIDLANQYGNLAYIHAMKGNVDEAVQWYGQAKQLYLKTGEREKAGMVKNNIDKLLAGSGRVE